jgi:hypothetical protein
LLAPTPDAAVFLAYRFVLHRRVRVLREPFAQDMTPTPTSAQLAQTGKASPEPDVMAPVFPETNQRQTDARIDLKLFEPRQ